MRFRDLLPILFSLTCTASFAQTKDLPQAEFNKLSVNGAVGFTKPFMNFTDGYFDDRMSPLATELGLRYMLNEYFGFKLDLAYNQFIIDQKIPSSYLSFRFLRR